MSKINLGIAKSYAALDLFKNVIKSDQ